MPKFGKVFALGLAFFVMGSGPLLAKMLILEASDEHSAYDNLPDFIKSISDIRQRFLAKNPDGQVVLLINGDFSGQSEWNFDHGQLGYEVLAKLAPDYRIVVNMGNHEAFDYGGDTGNRLFLQQAKELQEKVSRPGAPFAITTANLELVAEAKSLFQDFVDVPLTSGSSKKVRFVGMVLPRLYEVSDYDPKAKTQVFSGIRPLDSVATEQLETASRVSGVTAVVFALHDDRIESEALIRTLAHRKTSADGHEVKMPVLFAGHDHVQATKLVEGTQLIDAQSKYAFAEVVLGDDGRLLKNEFHGLESQKHHPVGQRLTRDELMALAAADTALEKGRAYNELVLGQTRGFSSSKLDLKAHRDPLGDSLSDSMTAWGWKVAHERGLTHDQFDDCFAMFNSSSYRREQPIPAGPVTREEIRSIYPFIGSEQFPRLVRLTGAEIQILFTSLRRNREQHATFSPQISSNLQEGKNYQLNHLLASGKWEPLVPDHNYLLALSPWLDGNGYKLPEWDKVMAAATARHAWVRPVRTLNFRQLLTEFWVPELDKQVARQNAGVPAH